MRVLVIFAHPLEDSYAAALRNVVVETLSAGGHKVDLCDLYREIFDPVMSARERSVYKDTVNNFEAVREYVERLRQAEGVVFVFPSWWYGMPAILKGYLDRVWLPGVAFEFGPQAIRPLLTDMRLFGAVTTTGAPAWFTRIYMGNPSRKVLMRGLATNGRAQCRAVLAGTLWNGKYDYSDSSCFHRAGESAHRTDPGVLGQVLAPKRPAGRVDECLLVAPERTCRGHRSTTVDDPFRKYAL